MTKYFQDTEIEIDEYAFKTVPGLVLYDAWLSVSVDRSCSREGEWCIDALYVVDKKANKCITYKNGDWLFDTIYKEIANDYHWEDLINRKCADEDY